MATADQLKALIQAHFNEDTERFNTSALQIAAHEAGSGHGALAHDIRLIIDKGRRDRGAAIIKFPQDMRGMVVAEEPDLPRAALVLPTQLMNRIQRVISEYDQQHKLKSFGLSHRRKVLLVGPPGTGKTMTACAGWAALDVHPFGDIFCLCPSQSVTCQALPQTAS